MRSIFSFGKLLGAVLIASSLLFNSNLLHADVVLMSDNFNYPNGNLVGNGGWQNHSGTGSFIQVNGGAVTLAQGAGPREDANKAIGSIITATDVWRYEFDVTVSGATPVGSVYFSHFKDNSTSGFASRLFVTAGVSGDYRFGIGESALTATLGTDFNFGNSHRVSVEYDAATRTSRLWVDGNVGNSVTSTAGTSLLAIQTIAFRQAAGNTNMLIDNLSVSSISAVPEPASMLLLGVAGVGGLAFRRFRRKNAISEALAS